VNTPRFWSLPVPVLKFPLVITFAAVAFCTISMPAPNAVSADGSYDTWRNSHSADTAGQQRRQMICGCAFHVCPQIVFGIVEQVSSVLPLWQTLLDILDMVGTQRQSFTNPRCGPARNALTPRSFRWDERPEHSSWSSCHR
jgi:hypothetical protein